MHIERTIAASTVSLLCAAALGAGVGSAAMVGGQTVKVAPGRSYQGMPVRYPYSHKLKVRRHRPIVGGGGTFGFDVPS